MPVIRAEPLDTLVVAALRRRPGAASAVSAALHPVLRDLTTRRALTRAVQARWADLTERGWLRHTQLTELGNQAVDRAFGADTRLSGRSWRGQLIVPALQLAHPTEADRLRLTRADPLRAEVARQRFALPLDPMPELDEVVVALGYGPARRGSRQAVRSLAQLAVGAADGRVATLVRAMVSRWAQGLSLFGDQPAPASVAPARSGIAAFPAKALRAARTSPTGRVGDTLVLISHAWRQLHQAEDSLSLDRFKNELVTAHRQRSLSLKAADMPQLYDPSDLAESEVHYRGSRFHFIRI